MADKNPQVLDALYFRDAQGGAVHRQRSVQHRSNSGNIIGNPIEQGEFGSNKPGKRINHAAIASTNMLLTGNYGVEANSRAIDRDYKPYQQSNQRSSNIY
jgi:hypothetical protein